MICRVIRDRPNNFYPRSPCGERRSSRWRNSTGRYFYPRSPCGERLWVRSFLAPFFIISIHALLAESDRGTSTRSCAALTFLSTLSLRRATQQKRQRQRTPPHFYPRSPCGERPCCWCLKRPTSAFLSTLSLRRATQLVRYLVKSFCISIHALLAESDGIIAVGVSVSAAFLSTLSLRRATLRRPGLGQP